MRGRRRGPVVPSRIGPERRRGGSARHGLRGGMDTGKMVIRRIEIGFWPIVRAHAEEPATLKLRQRAECTGDFA